MFIIARMPPSEVRAMSNEELRYWCDLIVRRKQEYFEHRGS